MANKPGAVAPLGRAFWREVWGVAHKTGTVRRVVVLALKMVEVVFRTGALVAAMGLHFALATAFSWMFSEVAWQTALRWLKGALLVGFSVVYVALVYEIVAVFVPCLKRFLPEE
jgi:fatty acid desaturase